jgi:retron-type reverse transcriptase
MKRYGNLWSQITAFENLLQASKQAQKGKRFRPNVLSFNYQLETELFQLQTELQTQTYIPGEYHTFEIYEPKPRLISAAPYRDRVVHHALCNVIVPIFDRGFISDSYANRVGYGTHRALRRFVEFARSSRYVLQCDIQKYFPSIDHDILKSILFKKLKCPETIGLMDTIINCSNPQVPVLEYFPGDDLFTPNDRRRGLPIGNLTSQFFANCYLNELDHFVKRSLKCQKYLRYVDDFALFSDDRSFLAEARSAIEEFLCQLRLKIHPIKSQLFETAIGANFVGFRVLSDRIRVRNDNLRRGRKRMHQLETDWLKGTIDTAQLQTCLRSWNAYLSHGDTWRLREKIFRSDRA